MGERSPKPISEKLLVDSSLPNPRIDEEDGLSILLKSREDIHPLECEELQSMGDAETCEVKKLLDASSMTSGILLSGGDFMTPCVLALLAASSEVGESSRDT